MMEELMKIVLEGAKQQQGQQQRGGQSDILMDILKGAMGGGQAAPQQQPQQQQPKNILDIADILGGVLGGATQKGSGAPVNPLIAPIANMLSQKLGISPAIAQIILTFALSALLNRGQKSPSGAKAPQGQTYDLDDLLEGDFAFDSGMANQISQKTGLSEDEAAYNLQEAMMMITEHPLFKKQSKQAPPKAQASPNKLDHLLDSWQVDG
jgi:hypothetical protein